MAVAQMRAKDATAAQREMDALQALKVSSPLIAGLAAEVRLALKDNAGALVIYRAAQRFSQGEISRLRLCGSALCRAAL